MTRELESTIKEIEDDIQNFKTIELITYFTSAGLSLIGYILNNPNLMLSGMAVYQGQTNISRMNS